MGSCLARLLLVLAAVGYPPIDSPATSPRVEELRRAVSTADRAAADAALTAFWAEVRSAGSPLVEPGASERPHERLVTFLYQSAADVHVVVVADFADYVPHMTLADSTTRENVDEYFQRLQDESLNYAFPCDRFALLRKDAAARSWGIVAEFLLV